MDGTILPTCIWKPLAGSATYDMGETLGVEAETIGPGLFATTPGDVRPWAS